MENGGLTQEAMAKIAWYESRIESCRRQRNEWLRRKDMFLETRKTAREQKEKYEKVRENLKEIRAYIKNASVGINSAYSCYEKGYVSNSERANSDKIKFKSVIEKIDLDIVNVNSEISYCEEKIAELEGVIRNCDNEISAAWSEVERCDNTIINCRYGIDELLNYQ